MGDLAKRVLELATRIQRIPSPTFAEQERAEYLRDLFIQEGLDGVCLDSVGNACGRLSGTGSAPPLVVCAHLDTVFPPETDLRLKRQAERLCGPGIGDNSIGVAALLGLVWLLRQRAFQPPGDLWLIADVGEEGLGDLRGMRAVVKRFGGEVQTYLIVEGMALGHVYHRALAVQRYRLQVHTAGGHSWTDYGQPSAVHELAALIVQLTALQLPQAPRTTLNVGKVSGGISVNVLASQAELELDLRSEESNVLEILIRQVQELVAAANHSGVKTKMETIGRRPAGSIPAGHPLVRLAEDCLRQQGLNANLTIGSTDANLPLSQGYPAICLGVTTGGGAHTPEEFINTPPLRQGLEQLAAFVTGVWEV
jgi:tripeptide aminopeptidase